MPKQPAIPGLREAMKKKATRREQFLAAMEAVVPRGPSSGADRTALSEGGAEGWGRRVGGQLHPEDAKINRIIAIAIAIVIVRAWARA